MAKEYETGDRDRNDLVPHPEISTRTEGRKGSSHSPVLAIHPSAVMFRPMDSRLRCDQARLVEEDWRMR